MLFRDRPHQSLLRWLAIGPISVVAAFFAFNFVAPFRLMQRTIWPEDAGAPVQFVAVVIDALLLLAPLMVVVMFAIWLTAPAAKILAVRMGAALLAGGASVVLVLQLLAQQWHGALVLGFGALAAVVTAALIVRYERRQQALALVEGGGVAADEAVAEPAEEGEPGEPDSYR